MSYSTSNPPRQILAFGFDHGGGLWYYESADAHGAIEAAGYFTNAGDLGMRVGDLLANRETGASGITWHAVTAVAAIVPFGTRGAATVSAAVLA